MEFLFQYGLFLAKAITLLAAVAAALLLAMGLSRRTPHGGGLSVEKLNEHYRDMALTLKRGMLSRDAWKQVAKTEKKRAKAESEAGSTRRRIFVLDFKGDLRATGVAALREEVSAVLAVAGNDDEVVVRLENLGGSVHEHGLAASQLQRLRDRGIALVAAVDKAAASGGYLMACVANRILAAPFAVIGSIGVIAQLPNFHRLLEAQGVDYEQITAGRYKRTLTMFGRNTDEDRAKLREELEDVHGLFKQMVARNRPALDIEAVATGEHWYGSRARELGLVDEIMTSDDYLLRAADGADLFKVTFKARPTLQQRVLAAFRAAADDVSAWIAQREHESRYR